MPTNAELNIELNTTKERVETIARGVDDLGDAVDGLTKSAEDTKATMAEILAALNGMSAKNRPSAPSSSIDAAEQAEMTGMMSDDGDPAGPDGMIEKVPLVSVDSPEFRAKAEMLAFMDEEVEVYIHDTSEKDADQNFFIGVNGRQVPFWRGEKKWVKRYIVEGLARCKPRQYSNQEYTMDDGRRAYRYPMRTGLRYGFSVVTDNNPRGASWLARLLQEP